MGPDGTVRLDDLVEEAIGTVPVQEFGHAGTLADPALAHPTTLSEDSITLRGIKRDAPGADAEHEVNGPPAGR